MYSIYTDTRAKMVPNIMCCTSVSESQISISFALRPTVFESHAILRQCTERPQNDIGHYKIKCTPYMCYYCHRVRFSATGHFETSTPNDPKMGLDTTRSSIHHIYVLLVSPSHKFHFFRPQPAGFEIQAILRQEHRMTPK